MIPVPAGQERSTRSVTEDNKAVPREEAADVLFETMTGEETDDVLSETMTGETTGKYPV